MSKKRQVTKKMRFEAFKRDGFQCAYCGKTPPDVTLEVDHIIPFSKGGECSLDNLITACFDCNRGKKNIALQKIPNKINENIEIIREQEEQLKEYGKLVKARRSRETRNINKISKIYKDYFDCYQLTDKFKKTSLKSFLKKLPLEEVEDAMEYACFKADDKEDSVKYFCGICWNKIREKD